MPQGIIGNPCASEVCFCVLSSTSSTPLSKGTKIHMRKTQASYMIHTCTHVHMCTSIHNAKHSHLIPRPRGTQCGASTQASRYWENVREPAPVLLQVSKEIRGERWELGDCLFPAHLQAK